MSQLLLNVARGTKIHQERDRTPIWFMRQAGRYLKGYQRLREKHGFLSLCKTPELALSVSLEPYQRFGVDGVILFSDIMIPAEAMGISLDFQPGPVIENPIRTEKDVQALEIADPYEKTSFVLKTLTLLKQEISGQATLIGFAGCPFTTATYMIDGKHIAGFPETRRMIKQNPMLLHQLLEKLYQTILKYLKAQIDAGAEIVQIFDSGTYLLSQDEYLEFAYPYEKRLIAALKPIAPVVLFLKDTKKFINHIKNMEPSVVSVDQGLGLDEASGVLGENVVLQGNFDPELLKSGTKTQIKDAAENILDKMRGKLHIFNLGHGVLKGTPVDNVAFLVDLVKNNGA